MQLLGGPDKGRKVSETYSKLELSQLPGHVLGAGPVAPHPLAFDDPSSPSCFGYVIALVPFLIEGDDPNPGGPHWKLTKISLYELELAETRELPRTSSIHIDSPKNRSACTGIGRT